MNASLIAILSFVVLFILLKFFSKIAIKILGFIAVIGLVLGIMYYKSWGPFKNNEVTISQLEEKYCNDEGDIDICECIIASAKKDMAMRFTSSEIDSLKHEKLKAIYVLKKSLDASKAKALACLNERGQEGKYKTFMQDFIPVDNEYLDLIGEKARDASAKVKDEIQKFKNNKDSIDLKY